MIASISHKGLRQFLTKGSTSGINPRHAEKILEVVIELAFVRNPKNYSRELRFHRRVQCGSEYWCVRIDGSWRLVFRRDASGNIHDLDYCQYH